MRDHVGLWRGLTGAPQGDALLLVGLADAVVAVAVHAGAGVAVMQVHVGGAVGAGARAELWQVARVPRLAARRARQLQLSEQLGYNEAAVTPGGGR